MTHIQEADIIKKAASGDKGAFENLVREHQSKVYNLAFKLLKNQEDASDAAQEAFLKAYINLKSFKGESKFSVWLYRLTYNHCIDFLRKRQKSNIISINQVTGEGAELELQIEDPAGNPAHQFEGKEIRENVQKGLDTLTDDQRQIIIMREFSGMSYAEIAQELHISEGTVKSRISRARHRLATFLINNGTYPESYRQNDSKGGDRQ